MADRAKILDLLTERVLATRAAIGDGWPSVAGPKSGRWHTTKAPDWCAGYWIEMLRIAGERTGDWDLYLDAAARAARLGDWINRPTMHRGPLFFYGAGRLYETLSDRGTRALALAAAYAGRTAVMPSTGAVAVGLDMIKGVKGEALVSVESVLGALQLDWWALRETGDTTFLDGAEQQLALTARDFIRDDGSTAELISYDAKTGDAKRAHTVHGVSPKSCWSRGHAAAIAGFLRAWEETGSDEWLTTASRLLDYWWAHTDEDGIPAFDFAEAGNAKAPRDTAAAAIVAEALTRLRAIDDLPEPAAALLDRLDLLVENLTARVTPQTPDDPRPAGMLLDGCANKPAGAATRHELIWGDYHLYAALHCLDAGGLPC
jgi:unsaturated chondroitin disaccharide hydrolase